MSKRRKKTQHTALVVAILGLGGLGAMPFLRPGATPEAATRREPSDLTLRGVPLHVSPQSGTSPAVGLYDDDARERRPRGSDGDPGGYSPTLDSLGPPPEFNSSYPTLLDPVDAPAGERSITHSAGRSDRAVRPVSAESRAEESEPRRHRILDGDTLAKLARKYLGNEHRAGEIYEVNRSLLVSPAVLPLGVEIVIPAR